MSAKVLAPLLAIIIACAVVSGFAFRAAITSDHHGVDEICKAFPSPQFQRPIEYSVVGADGAVLADGGCA